jgi:hypothetical protein
MTHISQERLLALSPTAFENLVFDLAKAGPLRNVSWRTPGSDGGRDLEGETVDRDITGHVNISRWLIECKRYTNSVDWPTVWNKIAYADSGEADFILIVATSFFTPKCIDEVNAWNKRKRRPTIRLWPLNELEFQLWLHQDVARKYGLIDNNAASAVTLAKLALQVARMTQAASAAIDVGTSHERPLFTSSCLAELLYARSDDLDRYHSFRTSPFLDHERLPNFVQAGPEVRFEHFDRLGLRATLACIYLVTRKNLVLYSSEDAGSLTVSHCDGEVDSIVLKTELIETVSFWAGFELSRVELRLCLKQQILM